MDNLDSVERRFVPPKDYSNPHICQPQLSKE
jgi:hypothetical protein